MILIFILLEQLQHPVKLYLQAYPELIEGLRSSFRITSKLKELRFVIYLSKKIKSVIGIYFSFSNLLIFLSNLTMYKTRPTSIVRITAITT